MVPTTIHCTKWMVCCHPCCPLVVILIKSVSPLFFRHILLWEGLVGPEKDQDVFVLYSTGRDGLSAGGAHLNAASLWGFLSPPPWLWGLFWEQSWELPLAWASWWLLSFCCRSFPLYLHCPSAPFLCMFTAAHICGRVVSYWLSWPPLQWHSQALTPVQLLSGCLSV